MPISKIEKRMLRWFGYMERMDDKRLPNGKYRTDVNGRVDRGRLRKKFTDQMSDI